MHKLLPAETSLYHNPMHASTAISNSSYLHFHRQLDSGSRFTNYYTV
jgi:hypothetical protein